MSFIRPFAVREARKKKSNRDPGIFSRPKGRREEALTRPSLLGGYYCSRRNNHARATVKASSADAQKNPDSVKINEMCALSFVECVGASLVIEMQFDGGGLLKVELEEASIQSIYLRDPNCQGPRIDDCVFPSTTISNQLARFIRDYGIVEVRKGLKKAGGTACHQELVFSRNDGIQLVVELSEGGIKEFKFDR